MNGKSASSLSTETDSLKKKRQKEKKANCPALQKKEPKDSKSIRLCFNKSDRFVRTSAFEQPKEHPLQIRIFKQIAQQSL
jgi:hypothetical protein